MTDNNDEIELDASDKAERKTLIIVLAINLSQVLLAGGVGFFANSTGLLGAALDNLSDAAVYIVSFYTVGKSLKAKSRAATLSGILLILLGLLLLMEVVRRYMTKDEPIGMAMIITAIINAASNVVNMRLLAAHKEKGVHIKASIVFTGNDMLVNIGIVLSGIAVMIFDSFIPDLVIGIVVTIIGIGGGIRILKDAREALKKSSA